MSFIVGGGRDGVVRLVSQQHAGSIGGEIMDDCDFVHPKVSGLIEIDITRYTRILWVVVNLVDVLSA